VEPGESPTAAASREIQEEAGLLVAEQDLGLVYAFTRHEAKIGKILTRLFFVAHVTATDVSLSGEYDVYSWREVGELSEAFAGRSWEPAIEFVLAHNLLQKGVSE
jgi:lipoyl(octanoyl) transferase